MDAQDFRSLQEAYLKVVENQQLDEAKEDSDMSPVVKRQVRNNRIRSDETTTEPELQTSRRVMHTAMRGQKKPEAKSRPTGSGKYGAMNRRGMSTSDKFRKEVLKRGMKEELDLYDIILSHLLDEGYAETQEQAEVIMVNMSEDWRESICEAILEYQPFKDKRKRVKSKVKELESQKTKTPKDLGFRNARLQKRIDSMKNVLGKKNKEITSASQQKSYDSMAKGGFKHHDDPESKYYIK